MDENYQIIKRGSRLYVVKKIERPACEANFLNSGMALVGVLQEGQNTIEDFIKWRKGRKKAIIKEAVKCIVDFQKENENKK